jgi:hypothetical protein
MYEEVPDKESLAEIGNSKWPLGGCFSMKMMHILYLLWILQ